MKVCVRAKYINCSRANFPPPSIDIQHKWIG